MSPFFTQTIVPPHPDLHLILNQLRLSVRPVFFLESQMRRYGFSYNLLYGSYLSFRLYFVFPVRCHLVLDPFSSPFLPSSRLVFHLQVLVSCTDRTSYIVFSVLLGIFRSCCCSIRLLVVTMTHLKRSALNRSKNHIACFLTCRTYLLVTFVSK